MKEPITIMIDKHNAVMVSAVRAMAGVIASNNAPDKYCQWVQYLLEVQECCCPPEAKDAFVKGLEQLWIDIDVRLAEGRW